MNRDPEITKELARGTFTDEMLADMRSRIGTEIRTDGFINNEVADRMAILRFAEGIGDDNPLWIDPEYGATSVHGTLIAPPSFIFACLASVQFGWAGLGGFHAETTMTFHRPVRLGDRISTRVVFDGFEGPTESRFAGRRIKDYLRQEYTNHEHELVATFICSRVRFERTQAQKRRESRAVELPHPWTEEQLAAIEADVLAEQPRGASPRYWEEVAVGDEIDVVTKGPIGLTDEIAFIAAGAAPVPRIAAHRVSLKHYRRHPRWAFRDPVTHALEPVYSVHYNDYAAKLQGAQMAYDVGIQRTCWQIHSLTNWMGDTGFLKALTSQYRAHVYLSDVVRLGGRVVDKAVDADGDSIVRLETWASNQRGDNVMPGTAVIALPHRGSSEAGGDPSLPLRAGELEGPVVEVARWGDRIGVEWIHGVPFRMYAERPRRVEHLLAFASRWGARPHVVQGELVLTFDDFRHSVSAKKKKLVSQGVGRGERIGVMGWNSPDYVVNFWAILAAGAVPALFNTWWSEVEVGDALELLRPALVLADRHATVRIPSGWARATWETHLETAAAGVDAAIGTGTSSNENENEPAVIIFTSGTAGRPKAVVLSHRALLANLQMLLHMTRKLPHQVNDTSADVALHTGPLFHIGGAQGMMRGLTVGNTLVLPGGRFDPGEALVLIEQWKVTRWAAVPTMVTRVLEHPDVHRRNLRSLRAVTLGGAPLHVELQQRIRDGLPGVNARIATGYGLSENGGQATAASHADTVERPGTSGRPLPLTEITIGDPGGLPDGEIFIRAPTQMSGYYGSTTSPIDNDGWLSTGDLGRMDEAGYIWITGRSKDLIIRAGENVAPAAVEQAIVAAPGVRDAVVFGLLHPDLGEEVAAVIVVDEGSAAAVIEAHVRTRVASFAVPTWWRFQTEPLPVNPTGKVDKPAVVAQVRAELARQRVS